MNANIWNKLCRVIDKKMKNMEKVLVVSKEYSVGFSGAGTYIYSIIKRTQKYKYIILANLIRSSFNNDMSKLENVKVKCKSFTNVRYIRYVNTFLFMIYSFFSSLRMEFDYIVGNDLAGNIAALFIHFVKKKPLVSVIHNISYEGKTKFIRRSLLKMIFGSSSTIIVNGKKLEDDINKSFGHCYKQKIVKIYPGVEILPFEKIKKPKKNVILFVGAIYGYKKGEEYLIEAFAHVLKRVDSELWIVGAIVNKKFGMLLKDMVNKLGIKKRVKFFGFVDNVFSYYDVCDVFVLPSYSESETFGIPCIEASAMGKPVVATDVLERNGAVVDKKTGIVVPRKNSKKLAEAIIKLLKDEKLRIRLGKNGKIYTKKFSWSLSAKKFENVIDKVSK